MPLCVDLTSNTLLDPSGSVAKLEFPSSGYIRYVGLIGTIWDTMKGSVTSGTAAFYLSRAFAGLLWRSLRRSLFNSIFV